MNTAEQSAVYAQAIMDRDKTIAALIDALGECYLLLDNSDVRYYVSNKLGEQAALHSALNSARKLLRTAIKRELIESCDRDGWKDEEIGSLQTARAALAKVTP